MSSKDEKSTITENFADLIKNLSAKEIIDDMKQDHLLTENEHSDIEGCLDRGKGRDANSKLLKALQKKKPGSLKVFIQILKNTEGSEYLGTQLEASYTKLTGGGVLPTVRAAEETHSLSVPQQVSGFIVPESDPEHVDWRLPVFTEGSVVTQEEGVDDSIEQYRMKSSPRGLAVIINNKVFTGKMKKREGTDLDADGLVNLFRWLSYDVRLFTDLKGKQMMAVLRDVARLDHSSVDSLVVAILTHGVENELYGSDEELIPVAEVFKPFNGYSCPSLVGKPKVFLIQACRGGVFDYGVEHTDGETESEEPAQEPSLDNLKLGAEEMYEKMPKEWKGKDEFDGRAQVLPAEADVVAVYATVPGYVSWRNSAFGSWFIKAFVDVMFEHAAKSSFVDILTMVNNRVALKFQSRDGNKQIPQATLQLTKLLYFNPPHPRKR